MRRRRFGHNKRARKRASLHNARHKIINVNPGSGWRHNYIFAFGAYGDTLLRAWGDSLQDALDEAADWASDHAPGLLVSDDVIKEAYDEAIAEGKSEEEAWEYAEQDTSPAGGYGQRIMSHEWHVVAEDPTREQILQIQGRA